MKKNTTARAHERPSFNVKRSLHMGLGSAALMLLQACGSTTPVLDAQFGSALMQAKAGQSLPPTEPRAAEAVQQGAGLPSATESLRGLLVHNTGRPTPSALTAK
ncbi:MAG: hypothetical protein ACOYB1_08970 [Limnohabitans sp.]